MRLTRVSAALVFVLGLLVGVWVTHSAQAGERATPTFDNVLRADLESAEGLEVIVSLVEIPAETTLPQHRQLLNQQVKATEAEIAMLKRRLRDYEPFLRVGDYSPARTAAASSACDPRSWAVPAVHP